MKLKRATIFTGIYLIHYDIYHLASVRHRVSFSIHTPISDLVSRLLLKIAQTDCQENIQRTESTSAVFDTVMLSC